MIINNTKDSVSYLLIGLSLLIFLTSASLVEATVERSCTQLEPQTIQPETTAGLQAFFQTLEYKWPELEIGVPPFILESFPQDIGRSGSVKTKKRAFFMGLLPMVLLANQEIEDERHEILQILERSRARTLKNGDRERLMKLSKRYGLRGRPLTDHRARKELLHRVDTIPPDLALAQAANESAWGTSRFARQGNNLFGEWTFRPGTGIVPAGRPDGQTYEVRKFKSLYASIRSYMNNLNSNSAYRQFRDIRSELREADQPVTGAALASGLLRYSQRGEEYIKEIQSMIRHNNLAQTNVTLLCQSGPETITTISTSGSGLFSSRNRIIGHRSVVRHDP